MTNNVGGAVAVGAPWIWTVTVANIGSTVVTVPALQAILFDHLPTANVVYGRPTVTASGGAAGPLTCDVDFSYRLACFASGGAVTLPPGSSFQVALTATASAPAVFANPRAGMSCPVDPIGILVEADEANNVCADTVVVGVQAAVGPQAVANDPNNDDEDEDEPADRPRRSATSGRTPTRPARTTTGPRGTCWRSAATPRPSPSTRSPSRPTRRTS